MSIELRAVFRTVKMLAIASIVPFIVLGLFQLSPQISVGILMCGVVAYFIWLIYSINLSQLQSEDALTAMKERETIAKATSINK